MKRKGFRLFVDIISIGAWLFAFWYNIQIGVINQSITTGIISVIAIVFILLISYGYLTVHISEEAKELFKSLWEGEVIHSIIAILAVFLLISGAIYVNYYMGLIK